MDLRDKQWDAIKGSFPEEELKGPGKKGGRPFKDTRSVLNGVLWVLRTGAPWADLPDRYPPYQTCHRRFQKWSKSGLFPKVLTALRKDLCARGGLEDIEGFIDGSYVGAKKGGPAWGEVVEALPPRSWRSQTAMVFHSLWLLVQETDTTVLSQTERSMLRSWLSSPQD